MSGAGFARDCLEDVDPALVPHDNALPLQLPPKPGKVGRCDRKEFGQFPVLQWQAEPYFRRGRLAWLAGGVLGQEVFEPLSRSAQCEAGQATMQFLCFAAQKLTDGNGEGSIPCELVHESLDGPPGQAALRERGGRLKAGLPKNGVLCGNQLARELQAYDHSPAFRAHAGQFHNPMYNEIYVCRL